MTFLENQMSSKINENTKIQKTTYQQYMLQTELPKVYFKVLTMLFYKMSRNDHNIRKKPIFSCTFQHGENFVPFRNLKNLTLSKNTLQNLTVTNATAILPNRTTVRNFVPYGTILKGNTLQQKKILKIQF